MPARGTADGRCRKTREPFRVSSKARSARPSDGADLKCGAGRTDAGVHALAQAHVDMDATVPPETFRRRVNDALPSDINVLRVERARHRFHARHDAVARSYLYQIARRRTAFAKAPSGGSRRTSTLPRCGTAAHFVGLHDFQSFSDDDPEEKSTHDRWKESTSAKRAT